MLRAIKTALTMIIFSCATPWAPAAPLNVRAPLASFITEDSMHSLVRELPRACPQYTLQHSLETFLTPEFFAACIEKRRPPNATTSPFFTEPPSPLEHNLRAAIAPLWLTLDMTKDEIARREAGLLAFDFKPLATIAFTNFSGHKAQTKWLRKHGIFLVRDFERAHAFEMQLPEPDRWYEFGRQRYERVVPFLRGLEVEKERYVRATLAGDKRATVMTWLDANARYAEDESVRASCANLLAQLGRN